MNKGFGVLVYSMLFLFMYGCTSVSTDTSHQALSAFQKLETLKDPQFNGGLSAEEIALSQQLAAEVAAQLPPQSVPACDAPNPLAGEIVGNLNKQPDPDVLLKRLPHSLSKLTEVAIHGEPVQRAMALHAIALIGRQAASAAPVLEAAKDGHTSSWKAEALDALTCEHYWSDGIAGTVPASKQPPQSKDTECDTTRASWILDQAADRSRTWPVNFFDSAWDQATQDCSWDNSPRVDAKISPQTARVLVSILENPAADQKFRLAIIDMLIDTGPQAATIARAVLPLMNSKDDNFRVGIEVLVTASGIPESVDAFRRWLLVDDGFNWSWVDHVKGLAKYKSQVVPILAEELHSPVFGNRAAAARALGELNTPQAIPALIGSISSLDWPTTRAAIASVAPYSATHPEVKKALERVAKNYWSPWIQSIAKKAIATGQAMPDCSMPHGGNLMSAEHDPDCVEALGAPTLDHEMPKCKDGKLHDGWYRTSNGKIVIINWRIPKRQSLPRGTIAKLSSWCGSIGEVEILPVKDGWLAGCIGFESSGSLVFLPRDESLPAKPVVPSLAASVLVNADGNIYAAGAEAFEFGYSGGLYKIKQKTDGSWYGASVAALPSVPTGVAVLGSKIAFEDGMNVVLFDPEKGISALSCMD